MQDMKYTWSSKRLILHKTCPGTGFAIHCMRTSRMPRNMGTRHEVPRNLKTLEGMKLLDVPKWKNRYDSQGKLLFLPTRPFFQLCSTWSWFLCGFTMCWILNVPPQAGREAKVKDLMPELLRLRCFPWFCWLKIETVYPMSSISRRRQSTTSRLQH